MAAHSDTILPHLSADAYLSRHFQTIDVQGKLVGPAINVGTWDLQDKCFVSDPVSLVHQGAPGSQSQLMSNSPFDANESVENYKERKKEQIQKIMSALDAGEDIINLQKIDFLNISGNDANLNQAKEELQEIFYERLAIKGYKCVKSEDSYGGAQQALAVIYNANKFELQESKGVLPYTGQKGQQCFHGFETRFQLKGKWQSVAVQTIVNTNLHLQDGHDCKEGIEDYQRRFENQARVMHVMAGRCNNFQNLPTALGSWTECTSIGKSRDGNLTIYQEGSKEKGVRAYHAAFVTAPSDYKVQTAVNRDRSEQFTQANGKVQLQPSNDTHPSCTRVGERWRRGKDILEEKAAELLSSDPSLTNEQLLNNLEIQEIIAEKRLHAKTQQEALKTARGLVLAKATKLVATPEKTPLQSVKINGVRVAPFKNPECEPYGGFANTTNNYPVKQGFSPPLKFKGNIIHSITWPSSEHAFHAQKLLLLRAKRQDLAEKIDSMLIELSKMKAGKNEYLDPRKDFQRFLEGNLKSLGYADLKSFYEAIDWKDPVKDQQMAMVIDLKFSQHPQLANIALALAREGIYPVEASRHDGYWASNADGSGENRLGIIIFEWANTQLLLNQEPLMISDPRKTYPIFSSHNQQSLGHNVLEGQIRALDASFSGSSSSSSSSNSNSNSRGQVLFIINETGSKVDLTAHTYNRLLDSRTGRSGDFGLRDGRGETVQGGNKDNQNSPFTYPGNDEQVLDDPTEKNPNAWTFRSIRDPQFGARLAKIAQELTTEHQNGCALSLPNTFYTPSTFGTCEDGRVVGPVELARREELAARQMETFNRLLDQGVNIVLYVIPHKEKGSAFNEEQFIFEKEGVKYDLAFWGDVNKTVGYTTHLLAAIYADGVRQAMENKQQADPISRNKLWAYLSGREGSLSPFSLFGKFNETEKVVAAAKCIRAIIYNHYHGSMDNFPGERLTGREWEALNQENSELKKAIDTTLVDPKVKEAILNSIKPASAPGMKQKC